MKRTRIGSAQPQGISGLSNARSAFTLIELLVVIAIIAILAAILFPVFAQALEKVLQIACLSNIKQLSTGMIMYGYDYVELFPTFLIGVSHCGVL